VSVCEIKPFDSAIQPICMRIKEILYDLPLLYQQAINEIRFRVGRPVTLHTPTRVDLLKHNGKPLLEALCHINTASNIVTLQTMLEPSMNLDLDKVYVEVNLFGDLEPLEDEED